MTAASDVAGLVLEALRSSAENGYAALDRALSARGLAENLIERCSDLEDEDPAYLAAIVEHLRQRGLTP